MSILIFPRSRRNQSVRIDLNLSIPRQVVSRARKLHRYTMKARPEREMADRQKSSHGCGYFAERIRSKNVPDREVGRAGGGK